MTARFQTFPCTCSHVSPPFYCQGAISNCILQWGDWTSMWLREVPKSPETPRSVCPKCYTPSDSSWRFPLQLEPWGPHFPLAVTASLECENNGEGNTQSVVRCTESGSPTPWLYITRGDSCLCQNYPEPQMACKSLETQFGNYHNSAITHSFKKIAFIYCMPFLRQALAHDCFLLGSSLI